jgi:inosine-uridine nucleoside N-ribohydrolase
LIDTDGGMDDLVAIAALFQNHVLPSDDVTIASTGTHTPTQNSNLKTNFVSNERGSVPLDIPYIFTVGGMQNSPTHAARYIQTMFPHTNVIPGLVGQDIKNGVEKAPSWLKEARKSINNFEIEKLGLGTFVEDNDAKGDDAQRIENKTNASRHVLTSFLRSQPDDSVDLLCLGPFTNVASWISDATTRQLMEKKLRQIWVMGGNLPPSQNEPMPLPEFNFAQDVKAVHLVFSSPAFLKKMWVVPFQTCGQTIEKQVWKKCLDGAQGTSNMVGKCLEWEGRYDAIRYDVMCAFGYVNSPYGAGKEGKNTHTIEWEEKSVWVDPATGLVREGASIDEKDIQGYPIKFVTWIEVLGRKGMLSWISYSLI